MLVAPGVTGVMPAAAPLPERAKVGQVFVKNRLCIEERGITDNAHQPTSYRRDVCVYEVYRGGIRERWAGYCCVFFQLSRLLSNRRNVPAGRIKFSPK